MLRTTQGEAVPAVATVPGPEILEMQCCPQKTTWESGKKQRLSGNPING